MYAAYGLALASDLELLDLDRSPASKADIEVRMGSNEPPSEAAVMLPQGLWVDGERVGIDVPDVGCYVCERGDRITIDSLPGASNDAIRLFLLGSALGVTLAQRGYLVLHGNAFQIGDGCAVVLGHSGAGKSTLAAEMDRRGYAVLSDDVVPVNAQGLAIPGWARMKLWQDALDRLGRSSEDLARVNAAHQKFHVPLRRPPLTALPVRWVYLLDRHEGPLALTPLNGATVFDCLHEHAYRNEVLVGELRQTHFIRSATLADQARFARLDRPYGLDTVASSADLILADVTSSAEDR